MHLYRLFHGKLGAEDSIRSVSSVEKTITMARRAVISSGGLKGYLLEEVVASLISKAGYRLLTDPQDDPHDLSLMGNGLQVRGRGGYHQADVLGELSWAPAFGNPIRLFIEAKWRGEGRAKVGIPEVRHAVGILQDVNQVLVTVGPRTAAMKVGSNSEDITSGGRCYCYTYRYALCSTLGFTSGAQAYALAHQVALLDLSHEDYDELRGAIDAVGDSLQGYIEGLDDDGPVDSPTTRNSLLRRIRATLRQELWHVPFEDYDHRFLSMLGPLITATREISELFVGVSATGFVILFKADHPDRMIRHMRADADPETSVHFRTHEDGSSRWEIRVSSDRAEPCKLFFVLPDAMLRALDDKQESGPRAAMNLKEQHFSRVTVYRITDEKSMICSLKLNRDWLANARLQLESRNRRKPPS
ncbi:hypothetical protein [Bradyrhizobium sp. SZCCHNR1020]|uniref:hypothetical protein n=1 Tax=Bradyrhizobium sp. SZCCHNR1020 TaxID=3057343 RepID=UPI002916E7E9|nr:hypothetical protein [Bradyrhizobium sp. SZCCHNR1020]